MRSLYLTIASSSSSHGGVSYLNRVIRETLVERFTISTNVDASDLNVVAGDWDAPIATPRLFVDHGSFADASFWAYVAPRLRLQDRVLVSSTVCTRVAARFLVDSDRVVRHVPFFVDTDVFSPLTARDVARQGILSTLDLVGASPVLMTVGGYSRRKNLHLSIRCLSQILAVFPSAALIIVGHVNPAQRIYREYLEDLSVRLGCRDRIRFLDVMPSSELRRLMGIADLLVHLTNCRLENFGLVVAEAMATGLPVYAADWGGLRDLVGDDRGILAPTYLSRGGPRTNWLGPLVAVTELLADRSRWQRLSDRARAHAVEELAIDRFRHRLCALVEECLDPVMSEDAHVTLSPLGLEAMFATLALYRRHGSSIRSTSDEFRLMLEGGHESIWRPLLECAATQGVSPRLSAGDEVYSVVEYERTKDGVKVTDPAWEGEVALGSMAADAAGAIALHAGGAQWEIALASSPRNTIGKDEIQWLIDDGLVCPRNWGYPAKSSEA